MYESFMLTPSPGHPAGKGLQPGACRKAKIATCVLMPYVTGNEPRMDLCSAVVARLGARRRALKAYLVVTAEAGSARDIANRLVALPRSKNG